ncbi:demethylmenaquinone methyltransferase [Lipingzhangella sp. LS1_29]|uniref:Demethylmenaquinone methyltransferase n=1 Tax=Lipingzhangella rawalii TaxID=2055835 RepID=A0ABU2H8V6_9ACTN|nr:demethylmenaquinone methyltransferase [Lipingzhangella rawalii]MDS1271739.1 demethylmenaquinone methyltransferase [Lipingzhangella rawalii]
MTRPDLAKNPDDVSTMFDQVAQRYDLLNTVMSAGQDRIWRRAVARELEAYSGELVLDLAAGTGTSSESFAAGGARVIACDFSMGMLTVGAQRRGGANRRGVTCVAGDAVHLPFAAETFDAVTISFGLRNVVDTQAALQELLRVTKPGGRLVLCEFSHPPSRVLDWIYTRGIRIGLPLLTRRLTPNPEAYEYLPESIAAWPDQRQLSAELTRSGWTTVRWRNLSLGAVAVHRATRPTSH